MRKVMLYSGETEPRYFDLGRHAVGEWHESLRGDHYIVTSVTPGEAVDEYENVDRGFLHTLRPATAEELAQREQEQAEWEALTPGERMDRRLERLTAAFPSLDWGD